MEIQPKVRLISATQWLGDTEMVRDDIVAYCARVSNPENQNNHETSHKLLKYLAKHKHWSPFEMVNMCVEIKTSRAIAAQILRHSSFRFQEFSQRYSNVDASEFVIPTLRDEASRNRQSSSVDSHSESQDLFGGAIANAIETYQQLREQGVARESARMVLPLATPTTLYMNGTLRSWIHYLQLRTSEDTQLEHRQVAIGCATALKKAYPVLGTLLETL